jgi:hypothetical protein
MATSKLRYRWAGGDELLCETEVDDTNPTAPTIARANTQTLFEEATQQLTRVNAEAEATE